MLRDRYLSYLRSHPEARIGDVCYTANAGRDHFAHRMAVLAGSTAELAAALDAPAARIRGVVNSEYRPRIAFVFTGDSFDGLCSVAAKWRSWGIEPRIVAGRGAGERVAQHLHAKDPRIELRSIDLLDGADFDLRLDIGSGDGLEHMLGELGRLYARGVDPDWKKFDQEYPRTLLSLPTYPFERRRCWLDESELKSYRGVASHAGGN